MAENHKTEILVDIQTRLAAVETDLENIIGLRGMMIRFFTPFVVLIVVQLGAFLYGYGQLEQKVADLDLGEFHDAIIKLEKNIDTALVVLADHGTELQNVRNEQARVRGNIDQIHILMDRLRAKVDTHTTDQFYKNDGGAR